MTFRLVTLATIMGKERWQAGMLMNASMGGPAVTITSQEHLTVFEESVAPLSSAQVHAGDKKAPLEQNGQQTGGTYEVVITDLYHDTGQLLPSYEKKGTDQGGLSLPWDNLLLA